MGYGTAALTALVVLGAFGLAPGREELAGDRVTILYDAFGDSPGMTRDWGYSALIEHHGRRILFDTGNHPGTFARNVRTAGVDLTRLDFVVISHRHLDHTAGLTHLLSVNPDVRIFAPREPFGMFGSSLPSAFYREERSLPRKMRYFDGRPPDTLAFAAAWPGGRFLTVDSTLEVSPGVHLISLVSETVGTREVRELSLALETNEGIIVVAGCSHPGIERIVQAAAAIDARVHLVFGGFHLPAATDAQVARLAATLHDTLNVERVAPGHCTGEPAFYRFRKTWKDRYIYAGVGSVVPLP